MSKLILYTTEDGQSQIQLRADDDTVWFSQLEIAKLFNATKQNISLHLRNIFAEGELDARATVKESLTVQMEGQRLLENLSVELAATFGKGFSYANLYNCRQFYLRFPQQEILYTVCSKLSWSHNRLIMRVDDQS